MIKKAIIFLVMGLLIMSGCSQPDTTAVNVGNDEALEALEEQLETLQASYDDLLSGQATLKDAYNSLLEDYNALYEELQVVEDTNVVRNQVAQNSISSLREDIIELKTQLNEFEYIYDLAKVEESTSETEVPIEDREVVVVTNSVDFLNAIGSNRHIILKAGDYNLSDVSPRDVNNKNVTWSQVYDGSEIIVTNVTNLRLEGEAGTDVTVMVEPRYADVLEFQYCQNVDFYNLTIGHTITKGECAGGVVAMYDCINFGYYNSVLYGCGTYGLTGSNIVGITFDNSIIEECTYGIVSIYSSSNLTFTNSVFRDNEGFDMFNIGGSSGVVVDNCQFLNNNSDYGPLLALYGTYDAVISNSLIEGNSGPALRNGDTAINLDTTEIKDNYFTSEVYELYD